MSLRVSFQLLIFYGAADGLGAIDESGDPIFPVVSPFLVVAKVWIVSLVGSKDIVHYQHSSHNFVCL